MKKVELVGIEGKMISRSPINNGQKPNFISMGTLTILQPCGNGEMEEVSFDFENSDANCTLLPDGRSIITFSRDTLDEKAFPDEPDLNWLQFEKWEFVEIWVSGDSALENYEDLSDADFAFNELIFTIEDENEQVSHVKATLQQLAHINKLNVDVNTLPA